MKRMVPLWITAVCGFVLIVSYFIPLTEGWGEVAAIWFDILAAIAFILGGGNLLKVHLKKSSDRAPGWGYSVVTLVAFLTMLYLGLSKWGAPPAPQQEHFGETFAPLPVASIPDALVFSIDGTLPERADGAKVHSSVRAQLRVDTAQGKLVFRGWMTGDQKEQLLQHMETLEWRCTVEKLYDLSQPQGVLSGAKGDPLAGKPLVAYYADQWVLSIVGHMTDAQRDLLLSYQGDDLWKAAVSQLHDQTKRQTSLTLDPAIVLPPYFDPAKPARDITYDAGTRVLTVTGPMAPAQRNELAARFPVARPLVGESRQKLLDELRRFGDFSTYHDAAYGKFADGTWKVEQLIETLNGAGGPQEEEKTSCQLHEEQEKGVSDISRMSRDDEVVTLNAAQEQVLRDFAADPLMRVDALLERLAAAGPLKGSQKRAARSFLGAQPTVGQRNRDLTLVLMKSPDRNLVLNKAQRDFLLAGYRQQMAWRGAVGDLFVAAHVVKYRWSGEYRAQGTPFWWLYEYAFKPLQATTFAMLAFYVASAAFRAFRAKNVEAILLLGTAFIILLGRTFAGVVLTGWLPPWLSGLKIENLTVTIMSVFNTAGNRAIMIGIALGIASTSLKVLLGVDRSYLGSGKE